MRASRILKNRVRAKARRAADDRRDTIRALNSLTGIMEMMNLTQESQNRSMEVLVHSATVQNPAPVEGYEDILRKWRNSATDGSME